LSIAEPGDIVSFASESETEAVAGATVAYGALATLGVISENLESGSGLEEFSQSASFLQLLADILNGDVDTGPAASDITAELIQGDLDAGEVSFIYMAVTEKLVKTKNKIQELIVNRPDPMGFLTELSKINLMGPFSGKNPKKSLNKKLTRANATKKAQQSLDEITNLCDGFETEVSGTVGNMKGSLDKLTEWMGSLVTMIIEFVKWLGVQAAVLGSLILAPIRKAVSSIQGEVNTIVSDAQAEADAIRDEVESEAEAIIDEVEGEVSEVVADSESEIEEITDGIS